MGLFRFLAKNVAKRGPGSIGRTAKVMAIAVNNLYHTLSLESPDEVFRAVVKQRYAPFPQVSSMQQHLLVKMATGATDLARFSSLIQHCWELDAGHPILQSFSDSDQSFRIALEVIREQLDRYLSPEVTTFLLRATLAEHDIHGGACRRCYLSEEYIGIFGSRCRATETTGLDALSAHDIRNGVCQRCGCSSDAIRSFKWECR